MKIFLIYPSESHQVTSLIPKDTSPFKNCSTRTRWYGIKKHYFPERCCCMPLKWDDAHQSVLISVWMCTHRRDSPLKSVTYTIRDTQRTSSILCYLHKLHMYALTLFKLMLSTIIEYKTNTHKRHLWIYKGFWMHFINTSLTTSQKFVPRQL